MPESDARRPDQPHDKSSQIKPGQHRHGHNRQDHHLGDLIRQLRQQRNVRQEDLAAAIGCSKAQLSLMESGQRSLTLDWARRIEKALGISDHTLINALHWQQAPPAIKNELTQARTHSRALASKIRFALASDDPVAQLRQLIEPPTPEPANLDAPQPVGRFWLRSSADRGSFGRGGAIPVINKVAAGYPTEFTDLEYPRAVADDYISCPDVTDPDAFAARVVGDSMEPEYREGDIVVFSPLLPTPSGSDCFVRFERDNRTTFKRVYFEEDGRTIRLQPLNNAYAPQLVDRESVNGMYAAAYVMRRVNGR